MATLTEPAPSETSGALFRALRSVGVDADLAQQPVAKVTQAALRAAGPVA